MVEAMLARTTEVLGRNQIVAGDSRVELERIEEGSVDLSFWSPPYHVGKSYEQDVTLEDWKKLIRQVIVAHSRILKPGGFMVVNIGDILCFPDPDMPRFWQTTFGARAILSRRKRS